MQWTVKDYTESNGWEDLQTLGYTFGKGHPAGQHKGICQLIWPCPNKTFMSVEWDKVPVVDVKNTLGKTVWVIPASGKGSPICRIALTQKPECP